MRIGLILIALLSLLALPAAAHVIDGKIGVETPVTADRIQDKSTMVLGSLGTRLGPRWTLTGSAQWNLGNLSASRRECLSEDKVKGLVVYDLTHDLSLYSYYERRFSLDQDRVVVGATWRFRGRW